MRSYVLRRALTFLITVWLAASLSFFTLLVLPGDPARLILGVDANPQALAALERQLGLDAPALVRYGRWLADAARLDLGSSLVYHLPVAQLIGQRLQVTLPLAGLALALATGLGVPLGLLAAHRRGGGLDALVSGLAQIGLALPSFWLGIFLILLFAVRLNWLPAGGFPGWHAGWGPALQALLLPAAALGAARAASLTRIVRAAALDVLGRDFVRTARAKGVPEARVLSRHVLRNALITISTVIVLELGQLLAGAVIIEQVFSLPGLGSLALTAVQSRDLPLTQGVVVVIAGAIVFLSFVNDLLYAYLDPRIRYA